MYSKEELSQINTLFWDDFKKIMKPIRNASDRRINWVNYNTHLKNVYLRLTTEKTAVALCFDIQMKDASIREIVWEQMGELSMLLNNSMQSKAIWEAHLASESNPDFCRISWRLENVNYLNEGDRPKIYNFFKEHLIQFDQFYDTYSEILIQLMD
jgi:hypothetical protein